VSLDPPPVTEPLLSLPLAGVVLALALIAGSVALAIYLMARRRRRSVSPTLETGAPWLDQLVEALPQAALVVDPAGHLLAWNAVATQVLSIEPKAPVPTLDIAALARRVLVSGTVETTELAVPNRPERHLRATASRLGSTGHFLGVLVMMQDPTRESRGVESYRRLVSAVSHELRTPLTAILGHADILGSCDPQRDEVLWRRSRDFIASEAQRLARLVEDLLTLSRLDLTPLRRSPVNVRAIVEEAISSLFQAAESRRVRLALQSPPSLSRVMGDRDRLHQAFLNLIDNAVKYSPDDSQVTVSLTPEEQAVQVEVRDSGRGIQPQDLPYIFEPLYRSEGARDVPGTGLGLTIVRTILEQHGSTIEVQSVPGQGTTFRFHLPYAQGSQAGRSDSSWR
jgi:signal transduction histidine kinase